MKIIPTLTSDKVDLTAIHQFTGELELNELHRFVMLYVKNSKRRVGELQHAFACSDFEKIRGIAHNMKSGALYIGAQQLSESCQYLQDATMTTPLEPKLVIVAGKDVQSELNEVINFLETWSDSVE